MEWQPIETAPKDGTLVLLWQKNSFPGPGSAIIGSFRTDQNDEDGEPLWLENDYDDWSTGYASTPSHPTHWMPLPPPPEAK